MKKLIVSLAMSAALAATLFTACTGEQSSSTVNKFDTLTTAQSVYGFSAASSAMVISDMTEQTPEQGTEQTPEQGTEQTPEQGTEQTPEQGTEQTPEQGTEQTPEQGTEQTPEQGTEQTPEQGTEQTPEQGTEQTPEQATGLDGYLTLVGSLLSDGGFGMISQTSDRAEYSEKMIVSCKDISGNDVSYIMYYNQLLTDREEDEDEVEETYSIEGVMLVDGAEYPIRGERESEVEDGESEAETSFRVTLGEGRYMLVEQSFETDDDGEQEQEYSYKIYENGKLTARSSFEYEVEDGKTEVKMTSFADGQSQVFYFQKDTVDGRDIIRLRVGAGKDAERYIIVALKDENGNVFYEYLDEGQALPTYEEEKDREQDGECDDEDCGKQSGDETRTQTGRD